MTEDAMMTVFAETAKRDPLLTINPMYVIIFLAIFVCVIFIVEYNKFVQLRHKIRQAKSGIDVYLTQRFDLIPNLVECVKGYAAHEERVFTEIARLRGEYERTKDLKAGSDLYNKSNDSALY